MHSCYTGTYDKISPSTPGETIQPAVNKTLLLHAFCSPDGHMRAAGNPCTVRIHEAMAASPARGSTSTSCATWQTAKREAVVRCWTADAKPIQCCGHGLLCCASVWLDIWGGAGSLLMGDSAIECSRRGDIIWLGFAPVPLEEITTPDWLAEEFHIRATTCSSTIDTAGYLVAELPADSDLSQVDPPGTELAAHTARALLVTCPVNPGACSREESFHYRYFAPQYGVPEDPATGSAMRVLTQYWNGRGLTGTVQARQCSTEGGLLWGEAANDRIRVGGHVA